MLSGLTKASSDTAGSSAPHMRGPTTQHSSLSRCGCGQGREMLCHLTSNKHCMGDTNAGTECLSPGQPHEIPLSPAVLHSAGPPLPGAARAPALQPQQPLPAWLPAAAPAPPPGPGRRLRRLPGP